ncbi:MAG: DUF7487 domain-containing protein [Nitrosopumilaceae archaeon]
MVGRTGQEEFIQRARKIHNGCYDYSLVEYKNTITKVKIICIIHGVFEQSPYGQLQGYGCLRCATEKKQQTWAKKSPSQLEIIEEKRKQTNLERYGVENLLTYQPTKEKIKQTNLERYGVEYPIQSKKIQKKQKQTNLKRYGVENVLQLEAIQEKIKQTNLERYGVENVLQLEAIQEKIKQTNLERYGVEYPNQQHLSSYCLERLKNSNWLKEQHHDNHRPMNDIARELNIDASAVSRYLTNHNIEHRGYLTGYSYLCITWLKYIIFSENIFIQHAQNIGEYAIPSTKYHADGYCQETNTIYEFHGNIFHGNPKIFKSYDQCSPFSNLTAGELYGETIKKENKIKELGYNLVVMWEDDWLKIMRISL